MVMEIAVQDVRAVGELGALIAEARGARGEVYVRAALPGGGEALVLLGRDFLLDGELAGRIESMQGVSSVALKTAETKRLALVE
jgi:DNA polymerase-3 subunit alpha